MSRNIAEIERDGGRETFEGHNLLCLIIVRWTLRPTKFPNLATSQRHFPRHDNLEFPILRISLNLPPYSRSYNIPERQEQCQMVSNARLSTLLTPTRSTMCTLPTVKQQFRFNEPLVKLFKPCSVIFRSAVQKLAKCT
jgi:hypothetical protein